VGGGEKEGEGILRATIGGGTAKEAKGESQTPKRPRGFRTLASKAQEKRRPGSRTAHMKKRHWGHVQKPKKNCGFEEREVGVFHSPDFLLDKRVKKTSKRRHLEPGGKKNEKSFDVIW